MKKSSVFLFLTMVSFSLFSSGEETLRELLDKRAAQSGTPPEIRAQMARHLDEVGSSGIYRKAKKVGDKAVDFTLKDFRGEEVNLAALLDQGPVVLTWYRGGW